MKFIATSDFRNVKALGIKSSGSTHPDQIDKGDTIEIGEGDDITAMSPKDQENIGMLYHGGRIISEDNVKGLALVNKELTEEEKKQAKLENDSKALTTDNK
jgi:hypothetical protein